MNINIAYTYNFLFIEFTLNHKCKYVFIKVIFALSMLNIC